MRFFLIAWLIVVPFAADAFGQAELARQRFEHGLTNAAQNRFEQALNDFQNALEKDRFASERNEDFTAKINYNIGVCLFRTGSAENSIRYFEAAIRLAKNRYAAAFRALGVAQSELGNWAAAKAALVSAVKSDTSDGESWFDLANVYLHEKDFASAAEAFQKAVRYKSVDAPAAINNLGVIAAFSGDWLKAEEQFETALAMSRGKLKEARRNLNLCRAQNANDTFVAKLEFVNQKN